MAFVLLAMAIILTISVTATQVFAPATLNSTSISVLPAKPLWEKTYGGTGDDRAFYALDVGDGMLVVGSTESAVPNATVGWALRLNSDGEAVWNRTFHEGSTTELRYALNVTGGFMLVGNQFTTAEDINGYIAKIDNQGNLIWQKILGGEKIDKLFSATPAGDGFVIFGLSYSYGNDTSRGWIVKLDADGNVVWNKTYGQTADTAARTGVLAPRAINRTKDTYLYYAKKRLKRLCITFETYKPFSYLKALTRL